MHGPGPECARSAPLGQNVFHTLEQVGSLLDHEPRPLDAAGLLASGRHEHDVTPQRHLGPMQRQHHHQLDDAVSLHVGDPATVDLVADNLTRERIDAPEAGIGRNHVGVAEQHDGSAPAPIAAQASDDVGTTRSALDHLVGDALGHKPRRQKVRRELFIAGRVYRREPDVLL